MKTRKHSLLSRRVYTAAPLSVVTGQMAVGIFSPQIQLFPIECLKMSQWQNRLQIW